jgi:hypothetical protein
MPKCTAKFVSAVFASILAGIPLATTSRGETVEADNCLAGPKGDTPAGAHWRYRIEHGTKRHCWYLREEGGRASQASPQNILPPAKPPSPPANPAPQHSLADARAELPPQTNRDDAPNTAAPAAAAQFNDAVRSSGLDANPSSAVVASRWPEPFGAVPSTTTQQPSDSNPASNMAAYTVATAVPAEAADIPVAEDFSPNREERGIMPLLVAILGAFTLAAAIIIKKFGRRRRPQPRKIRVRRGPIFETTDDDRIVLSDHPVMNAHMRRPRFARGIGETEDRKSEPQRRKSRRARTS